MLQTAQAEAHKPDAPEISAQVRVILDSGSQRSYITTELKDKLNIPTLKSEPLMIKTFNSQSESIQVCDVVQLCVSNKEGNLAVKLNAYCIPTICAPLANQNTRVSQSKYDHLASLKLADVTCGLEEGTIDILVGSDQYWQIVTGEVIKGESRPTAMNTKLGWVLSGPVESSTVKHESVTNLACTHVLKCAANPLIDGAGLDNEMKKFWELESLGIQPQEASVYEKFTNTISHKGGRYEVRLPWKHSHPLLPDNHKSSLQRFHSLYDRLKQTPEILEEYDNVIKDQLQKGIVERVDEAEPGEVGKVHYLPHHVVIRRDKETTRLRVVYDASSKSNGISLNSCLYTGPSLSKNILDILIRFRSFKVAMISDIEKAFLMVSIAEVDRNVLRFLWVDDISKDKPEIITLRFTRVVFGVSSSPFLLNATIAHHIGQYELVDPAFVEKFSENIYVDDLSAGGTDVDETYEFYVKSKLRLAEGGFNLRKFMSNSEELMSKIEANESNSHRSTNSTSTSSNASPTCKAENVENLMKVGEEDDSYTKTKLGDGKPIINQREQKRLGLHWNNETDCFLFDLKSLAKNARKCEPTKRNIVSVVSSIYDPIGFLSPITIQLKILLQELHERNIAWDESLDGTSKAAWFKLVGEIERVEQMVFPRCYAVGIEDKVVSFSLQGFCDASVKAYAAVIYLRIETLYAVYVRFVTSKSRVSPLDKQSIPRLELLSALLLAHLIGNVERALKSVVTLDPSVCWTDSKVSLYWITQVDKEWKQFIQNRVNEIRKLTTVSSWRHCPGHANPADIPSPRGMSPTDIVHSELWNHGPTMLYDKTDGEEHQQLMITEVPEECCKEMRIADQRKLANISQISLWR